MEVIFAETLSKCRMLDYPPIVSDDGHGIGRIARVCIHTSASGRVFFSSFVFCFGEACT